jgi:transcription elongation factor Elf1
VKAAAPAAGTRPAASTLPAGVAQIFACPRCGHSGLQQVDDDRVHCPACEASYARRQAIWDFKDTMV